MILTKIFKREPKMYKGYEYVIIKKNVKHQKIGGKKGYIDRKISNKELIEQIDRYNIACVNFFKRRPDLFEKGTLTYEGKKQKYYYVKVNQKGVYLGYVICSDEIVKKVKPELTVKNKNLKGARWI